MYDFDLFVIGAGSGGIRAARMSASYGAKVAVAEERHLGGTCVNVGCIPKKLFVYGSHFSEAFEDASAYGWNLPPQSFEWTKLRDNKTQEVKRLNDVYKDLLEGSGVEILHTHAKFTDPHHIAIEGRTVSSDKVLIATGSWPSVPSFDGSEHVITSNEAFYLGELPNRIVIVGGGYIAVEFASIFHGLGVETTVLYRGPLFLRGFDIGIREFIAEELRKKGIDVQFNSDVERIKKFGDRKKIMLRFGEIIEADCIMYAIGRKPLTNDLGLEEAQVKTTGSGGIVVDRFYRTSTSNIYAIGDVIDRVQLTPVAIAEGTCVAQNIFGDESQTVSYEDIPTAIFCQPHIGTVGPDEETARARHGQLQVFETEFRPLKHTLSDRDEKTFMKLLVDAATDKVIAAHMVGPEAGEIIQGIGVAIKAGATKSNFDSTIGIHPTSAEEFVTMREITR